MTSNQKEELGAFRLLMVISSISPLFILWAIRGNDLIPENYFLGGCFFLIGIPSGILAVRLFLVKLRKDKATLAVGRAEDHRDHILVYLFAMLLPFYSESITTLRDLVSTIAALSFVVFLFWHLNLHYMNIMFAVFGYRVFTVHPPDDGNPITGRVCRVVITKRTYLTPGEKITCHRISNTVYMEVGTDE